MTQRVKVENLKDGGPYSVIAEVKDQGVLAAAHELKPGEAVEIYIYGTRTIRVVEVLTQVNTVAAVAPAADAPTTNETQAKDSQV